ncbi:MAG: hypothetical protein SGARI_005347, partial [Bacillariaceae sp.]
MVEHPGAIDAFRSMPYKALHLYGDTVARDVSLLPTFARVDLAEGPKELILESTSYPGSSMGLFGGCRNTKTSKIFDRCLTSATAEQVRAFSQGLLNLPSLACFNLVVQDPAQAGHYWCVPFWQTILRHPQITAVDVSLDTSTWTDMANGQKVHDCLLFTKVLSASVPNSTALLSLQVDIRLVEMNVWISKIVPVVQRSRVAHLRRMANEAFSSLSLDKFQQWLAVMTTKVENEPDLHYLLESEFL